MKEAEEWHYLDVDAVAIHFNCQAASVTNGIEFRTHCHRSETKPFAIIEFRDTKRRLFCWKPLCKRMPTARQGKCRANAAPKWYKKYWDQETERRRCFCQQIHRSQFPELKMRTTTRMA